VYFSGRDANNRSQVGYFDFDIDYPQVVTDVSPGPVLTRGKLGSFDESGVMSSWIVDCAGKRYMYYIGWTEGVTVPFYNSIGLAVSRDAGKAFTKISEGPILGRDVCDPYFTGSSCVLVEGEVWRMWYLSCARWEMDNGEPKHYYHIKYAWSHDGIHWRRTGRVCIDFKSSDEYSISRPCVVNDQDAYKMWYSYRGESYRIGYAESEDGIEWERKDDEVGIDVSPSGWDSEMIEYPFVFDHEDKRYMLYNGNGYGKTGIGLAVLAEEE
jgi:hypothetical protein